jgi:hypothetical protein
MLRRGFRYGHVAAGLDEKVFGSKERSGRYMNVREKSDADSFVAQKSELWMWSYLLQNMIPRFYYPADTMAHL